MAIVTVGIDLAKNVFAVHGVDETGKPALVCPEVPHAKLRLSRVMRLLWRMLPNTGSTVPMRWL